MFLQNTPVYTLLPPIHPDVFWYFVATMALFVIAIHVHAILRD